MRQSTLNASIFVSLLAQSPHYAFRHAESILSSSRLSSNHVQSKHVLFSTLAPNQIQSKVPAREYGLAVFERDVPNRRATALLWLRVGLCNFQIPLLVLQRWCERNAPGMCKMLLMARGRPTARLPIVVVLGHV